IYVNSRVIGVARHGNDIAVGTVRDGIGSQIVGSHLLMAIGRRPNTDDLGLEITGIAVDDRGFIKVDDRLRTNVEGVLAFGDCNGGGAFPHPSYSDFEMVAADPFDHEHRRVSDRIPAYALYPDPPLGRVGMTETEVRGTSRPAM